MSSVSYLSATAGVRDTLRIGANMDSDVMTLVLFLHEFQVMLSITNEE